MSEKKYTLAIIRNIQNIFVDYNRTNIHEQIENIIDDDNNCVFDTYVDKDSLLTIIHNELDKPTTHVVSACNIFETKNYLYAGYYIDATDKFDVEDQNIRSKIVLNDFATQITSHPVISNFVIIKQKLSYKVENNSVQTITDFDTIYKSELIDVLIKIYLKDGLVIHTNGNIDTYQYIVNPIEHLILTDPQYEKHVVLHEYEIYTHVLIIIADTRENNGTLNIKGTLLANNPVNGTIFIAMYKKPEFNEQPPYTSISKNTLESILNIRQKSANLTTNFSKSDKEYVNFEKLLELENLKHSNLPNKNVNNIIGELLNIGINNSN